MASVALIFFGISCMLYGLLMIKSPYIPKMIGAGICLAEACYILNSVTLLAAPQLARSVFDVSILCLVAELTLALWLITKDLNIRNKPMN